MMKMELDLLTEDEIEYLDDFLLNRIGVEEEEYVEGVDEGIICISELDGFLTAVVSGPVMIMPSDWMPVVWGDFEPEWESEDKFMEIFSLMTRHLNGIVNNLMSNVSFKPLFLENYVEKDDKSYLVVDEWCEGYMRGVSMAEEQWVVDSVDMTILLMPIRVFSSIDGWGDLEKMNDEEIENIQHAIIPNVDEIHAYWLKRREYDTPETAQTYQKDTPRIGRNDPCPCGSGKKFKKCCLH